MHLRWTCVYFCFPVITPMLTRNVGANDQEACPKLQGKRQKESLRRTEWCCSLPWKINAMAWDYIIVLEFTMMFKWWNFILFDDNVRCKSCWCLSLRAIMDIDWCIASKCFIMVCYVDMVTYLLYIVFACGLSQCPYYTVCQLVKNHPSYDPLFLLVWGKKMRAVTFIFLPRAAKGRQSRTMPKQSAWLMARIRGLVVHIMK